MSGCHDSEDKGNTHLCIGCGIVLAECHCIWSSHRELYEMVSALSSDVDSIDSQIEDEILIRIEKLESSKLSQQLDPKVWVHVNERLDKLESSQALFELQLKVDEFKHGMSEGNRFMECLAGLEDKLQEQITSIDMQLEGIDEKFSDYYEIICADVNIIRGVLKPRQEHDIEINNLSKSIEKLQEMQNAMLTMPALVWRKYHKTPHKCPVCDGSGSSLGHHDAALLRAQGLNVPKECNSCEGKGIVWG